MTTKTIERQRIAEAIRQARTSSGRTQEDVARAIDESLSTYRGWERRATLGGDDLLRLSLEIGLGLDELAKALYPDHSYSLEWRSRENAPTAA